MEAATLSTVLLVTLYRTPASLEAGWKYFILCGVGIAQALFGTILLYFAAEKVLGSGRGDRASLDASERRERASSSRRCSVWHSCSCWLATARRSDWRRCTTGCPMRTRKARRRSPRSCPGCLLNVAIYAVVRCKVLVEGSLHSAAALAHAHGLWAALGGAGGVLPLAPARHQAAVRLLLDRAHGDHHLRLRHGRPGGQPSPRCCT